jgi:hypothetical protein
MSAGGIDSRAAVLGPCSYAHFSQDRPGLIDVSQTDLFEYGCFGSGRQVLIEERLVFYG